MLAAVAELLRRSATLDVHLVDMVLALGSESPSTIL